MKRRPLHPGDRTFHLDLAAMVLNNSVRNRKPQACSLAYGFGGKEGIKDPFSDLCTLSAKKNKERKKE